MNPKYDNTPVVLFTASMLLAFLVTVSSCIGIFTPDFYSKESPNWQAQAIGQDVVDLIIIVPSLIITSFLAFRNNKIGTLLWGGVLLYLVYTFTIYCFAVHFNPLFVLYCFILGLSFYIFLFFVYSQLRVPLRIVIRNPTIVKTTGIYFLTISLAFYFLWLSDILPHVMSNNLPKSLADSGLYTNPVHVIDLSVLLPGIFITGIMLLKKKSLGFVFAPVMLMFFILMNLTIGGLVLIMKQRGIEANLLVTIAMTVLALLSVVMLVMYARGIKSRTNYY